MNTIWLFVGVILAAALLARIIRQRNRAQQLRDRNYFKRHYHNDSD